jgi:hypothetical protein
MRAGQYDSMPFRRSDRCSILLNLRNLFWLFSSNLFSNKKGPRGFRRRSKSGRKRPGKGSDSGGWGSHRVSYFANPKAPRIDEAQFSARVSRFCVATAHIAADHVGGTRTPCSRRNAPTTLIASATAVGGKPVSQPVTGPIGRTRASAANNDARQGVDDPLDVTR